MRNHLILFFGLYALSAFLAVLLLCVSYQTLKMPAITIGKKTYASKFGHVSCFMIFMLALGTGADNLRWLIGGAFPGRSFGPGLVSCDGNITCANALPVEERPPFLEILTWFCYGSHEILGSLFVFPVVYLWVALPPPMTGEGVQHARSIKSKKASFKFRSRLCFFISLCAVCLSVAATYFFVDKEANAGALKIKYNFQLKMWSYHPSGESPLTLAGVLFFGFVNLIISTSLLCMDHLPLTRCCSSSTTHGLKWYTLCSYICFFGQGAIQALGDYSNIFSNCLEQVSLWTLLVLVLAIKQRVQQDRGGSARFVNYSGGNGYEALG
jgi:hypothetical protein